MQLLVSFKHEKEMDNGKLSIQLEMLISDLLAFISGAGKNLSENVKTKKKRNKASTTSVNNQFVAGASTP